MDVEFEFSLFYASGWICGSTVTLIFHEMHKFLSYLKEKSLLNVCFFHVPNMTLGVFVLQCNFYFVAHSALQDRYHFPFHGRILFNLAIASQFLGAVLEFSTESFHFGAHS